MDIVRWFLEKLAVMSPRFIRSRILHPEKKIQVEFVSSREQILSELNKQPPSQVPCLYLDFKITNYNLSEITLERMVLEIWFGQPTMYSAILKRHVVPNEDAKVIHFQSAVTETQKQQIEHFLSGEMGGQLDIYYSAYFETKVGLIEIKGSITKNKL